MREFFGSVPEKTPFWCRLGFHSWCRQSGFDRFYFCNNCSLVRRDAL